MRERQARTSELRLCLGLARAEMSLNLRSPGYRAIAVVTGVFVALALYGLSRAPLTILHMAPSAASFTRAVAAGILLLMAPILAAGAAVREKRLGIEELILSAPPSSPSLVWGKFLGVAAALLALIGIISLEATGAYLLIYPRERDFMPVLGALIPIVMPVLFVAALSTAIAMLLRSALSGVLVIALHLALQAGGSMMLPALQFTAGPYRLPMLLFALALVGVVASTWEARREPSARVSLAVAGTVVILLAAGLLEFRSVRRWNGWSLSPDTIQERLAEARSKNPALPDIDAELANGEIVSLRQYRGRPLVLVFWNSAAPQSAGEAAIVERAWRASGHPRLAFATVCTAPDPGQALDLARAAHLQERVFFNATADEATGLAAAIGLGTPQESRGCLFLADGTLSSQAPLVTPAAPKRRQPSSEWEKLLYTQALAAFNSPEMARL